MRDTLGNLIIYERDKIELLAVIRGQCLIVPLEGCFTVPDK
jgi:hypothetical protein